MDQLNQPPFCRHFVSRSYSYKKNTKKSIWETHLPRPLVLTPSALTTRARGTWNSKKKCWLTALWPPTKRPMIACCLLSGEHWRRFSYRGAHLTSHFSTPRSLTLSFRMSRSKTWVIYFAEEWFSVCEPTEIFRGRQQHRTLKELKEIINLRSIFCWKFLLLSRVADGAFNRFSSPRTDGGLHLTGWGVCFRCDYLRLRPGSGRRDASCQAGERHRKFLVDRFRRLERPEPGLRRQRGGGGGHFVGAAAGKSCEGLWRILPRTHGRE